MVGAVRVGVFIVDKRHKHLYRAVANHHVQPRTHVKIQIPQCIVRRGRRQQPVGQCIQTLLGRLTNGMNAAVPPTLHQTCRATGGIRGRVPFHVLVSFFQQIFLYLCPTNQGGAHVLQMADVWIGTRTSDMFAPCNAFLFGGKGRAPRVGKTGRCTPPRHRRFVGNRVYPTHLGPLGFFLKQRDGGGVVPFRCVLSMHVGGLWWIDRG